MIEVDIMVSVFMLAYNQENYIAQAIEGVLEQEVDFRFELVIGEDCSNDRTYEICLFYQEKYPGKIRILKNSKNLGLMTNFHKTSKELFGKYIAICDGDDFWINKHKLQMQVDFLEKNIDYSIVYGRTKRLYPNGDISIKQVFNYQLEVKDFRDLVYDNFIPSVTVLFKNPFYNIILPDWFKKLPYGDWPLYLIVLNDGSKIHFINEIFAVYRMQIGESFKLYKNKIRTIRVKLEILENFRVDPSFFIWREFVEDGIRNCIRGLMINYNKEGCYMKGFKAYLKIFFGTKKYSSRSITKSYFYSIYKSLCSR